MKISITKKGKIVLFVILGIIVLGSGGYLLWRVLQTETVAPEDSEAVGTGCGDCCYKDFGCANGMTCRPISCTPNESNCPNMPASRCTQYTTEVNCKASGACFWYSDGGDTGYCSLGTCKNLTDDYSCSTTNCEWPKVSFQRDNGSLYCDLCNGSNGCSTTPDKCSPPACPEGQVSCGISGENGINEEGCYKYQSCCTYHDECNNPYKVFRYCKPVSTETNTCEGGNWVKKPSGQYPYGSSEIKQLVVATSDKDGLGTITVTLNNSSVSPCTTTVGDLESSSVGATCYSTDDNDNITLMLDPGLENVPVGSYNITISWKDGATPSLGGDNCTVSTSFTVVQEDEPYCGDGNVDEGEVCDPVAEGSGSQCTNNIGETVDCASDCTCPEADICGDGILVDGEQCELGNPTGYTCTWDSCNQTTCLCEEQQNPDWTISKTGAEQCIEEGGETYAKAIYSITVTNVGEGDGTLDKVIDELDDKVLESYLNDISGNGLYNAGSITWDLEGDDEIFSPDESLTLTYYIKVPADSFGIYQNTAIAYPTEGDEFSDDDSVNLTCDIPQTGIFDSILVRISLGIVMILLGMNWSKINYSLNETISNTRIKKFERKVAKKK